MLILIRNIMLSLVTKDPGETEAGQQALGKNSF